MPSSSPQNTRQRRPAPDPSGHAYGYYGTRPPARSGMVGPTNPGYGPHTGADGGALAWAQENKWYLLGGGLIAAGIAGFFLAGKRRR